LQWRGVPGVEPVAIAIIEGISWRRALVWGRAGSQPVDDKRQL
jgi:hypothetical protein